MQIFARLFSFRGDESYISGDNTSDDNKGVPDLKHMVLVFLNHQRDLAGFLISQSQPEMFFQVNRIEHRIQSISINCDDETRNMGEFTNMSEAKLMDQKDTDEIFRQGCSIHAIPRWARHIWNCSRIEQASPIVIKKSEAQFIRENDLHDPIAFRGQALLAKRDSGLLLTFIQKWPRVGF
jgi:hypothetical protein